MPFLRLLLECVSQQNKDKDTALLSSSSRKGTPRMITVHWELHTGAESQRPPTTVTEIPVIHQKQDDILMTYKRRHKSSPTRREERQCEHHDPNAKLKFVMILNN